MKSFIVKKTDDLKYDTSILNRISDIFHYYSAKYVYFISDNDYIFYIQMLYSSIDIEKLKYKIRTSMIKTFADSYDVARFEEVSMDSVSNFNSIAIKENTSFKYNPKINYFEIFDNIISDLSDVEHKLLPSLALSRYGRNTFCYPHLQIQTDCMQLYINPLQDHYLDKFSFLKMKYG